jgi:hypothetical protein
MIYMHGSDARQHEIADTLSELAQQELKTSPKAASDRPRGKRSDAPMFVKWFAGVDWAGR